MQDCPSKEKIDLFVKIFSRKLKEVLDSEVFISFEIAYRPKPGSLLTTLMNEAGIDLDRYPSHLPRCSKLSIERKAEKIFVDGNFQSAEVFISSLEIEI